jgi:hypothetical protein
MTIVIDTPAGINAWILMSRVSQCHLHMKGMKVPGLAKWMKNNIPDVTTERTVKDMYPRLLDYCQSVGVEFSEDGNGIHEECNYQVLLTAHTYHPLFGLYMDQGVYNKMSDVAAVWSDEHAQGRVVIVRTMEDVRGKDSSIRMQMY